jgi:hypothetical protein
VFYLFLPARTDVPIHWHLNLEKIEINMRPIQMVDLKQQYQKIKQEVDTAVLNILENAAFINGPQVQSFSNALGNLFTELNM